MGRISRKKSTAALLLSLGASSCRCASGFVAPPPPSRAAATLPSGSCTAAAARIGALGMASSTDDAPVAKAPTLNGKAVLPVKAVSAGLKGHRVAAVYAVLNSGYKRG